MKIPTLKPIKKKSELFRTETEALCNLITRFHFKPFRNQFRGINKKRKSRGAGSAPAIIPKNFGMSIKNKINRKSAIPTSAKYFFFIQTSINYI